MSSEKIHRLGDYVKKFKCRLGDEQGQESETRVGYNVQSKGLCLLPILRTNKQKKDKRLIRLESTREKIVILLEPWPIHSGQ